MLAAIIDAYQDFLSTNPDQIKLVQYEIIRGGENLRKLNLIRDFGCSLQSRQWPNLSFFQEKNEEGEIRKVDIIPLIFTVIGSVVMP